MFNSKCSNEYISSTKLDVLKEKIKNRKNEKENSCRELIDFVALPMWFSAGNHALTTCGNNEADLNHGNSSTAIVSFPASSYKI